MTQPESLPPGVAELVANKPFYAEIEGRASLQFFDADSGKLQHQEDANNFLGSINNDYIDWLNRERYFRYIPNRGSSMGSRWPIDGMQTHLACFTDSRSEQTDQRHFQGSVVAYANRGTYVGTDTKRGTLNLTESDLTNGRAKWVFDWPTNAGNDLAISTIGWARLFESTNDAWQNGAFTSQSISGANVPRTWYSQTSGLATDDTNWYHLHSNWHYTYSTANNARTPRKEIYKINPQGTLIATLVYTHNLQNNDNVPLGLAWDGTNFWHGEGKDNSTTAGAGRLWLAPGNGGAGTLYNVQGCGPIVAVAVDRYTPDGRIFMLDAYNNKIHVSPIVGIQNPVNKVSYTIQSSGTTGIGSYTNAPQFGLAYEHPNKLWVYNGANNSSATLTQYDGSMNVLSRSTNGRIFTQNQGGLIYGFRTSETQFGATNMSAQGYPMSNGSSTFSQTPWQQENGYYASHSTAGDLNAATMSTATPFGPICFKQDNGKLYGVTDDFAVRVLEPWSLGTRVKLTNSSTKTTTQTMKVTYSFTWV